MVLDRSLLRASWQAWLSRDVQRAGPAWLQWLWTLLFCAALALPFTVLGFIVYARTAQDWLSPLGWAVWYARNFVVCLTIGVTIHLLGDLARRLGLVQRARRWRPWQCSLFFTALPMLGVAIGWPLGMALIGVDLRVPGSDQIDFNGVALSIVIAIVMSLGFNQYFSARRQRLELERRATEAQLRLLQGQIEPHFLFNTLANVLSLIDHDAPRARQMLESFTDYLRASLSTLRVDHSTLGAELELARTYLTLLKMRMEDRLEFSISVDDGLLAARLPPLLLQPLVENAIHHGLEPKIEGGHVRVSAQRDGATLLLQVTDDGIGLDAPSKRRGAGLALNNLRSRLQAQFAGQAGVELSALQPGTQVTIRLPYERPATP